MWSYLKCNSFRVPLLLSKSSSLGLRHGNQESKDVRVMQRLSGGDSPKAKLVDGENRRVWSRVKVQAVYCVGAIMTDQSAIGPRGNRQWVGIRWNSERNGKAR